jgi:hypothetical protein
MSGRLAIERELQGRCEVGQDVTTIEDRNPQRPYREMINRRSLGRAGASGVRGVRLHGRLLHLRQRIFRSDDGRAAETSTQAKTPLPVRNRPKDAPRGARSSHDGSRRSTPNWRISPTRRPAGARFPSFSTP